MFGLDNKSLAVGALIGCLVLPRIIAMVTNKVSAGGTK